MKYLLAFFACITSQQVLAEKVGNKIAPLITIAEIGRICFGLLLVVVIMALFAFVLKKMNGISTPQGNIIKIVASVNLSAREKIVLAQVGEKQLLLGVASGCVNTLLELDKPIACKATTGSGFIETLSHYMKRGDNETS